MVGVVLFYRLGPGGAILFERIPQLMMATNLYVILGDVVGYKLYNYNQHMVLDGSMDSGF